MRKSAIALDIRTSDDGRYCDASCPRAYWQERPRRLQCKQFPFTNKWDTDGALRCPACMEREVKRGVKLEPPASTGRCIHPFGHCSLNLTAASGQSCEDCPWLTPVEEAPDGTR